MKLKLERSGLLIIPQTGTLQDDYSDEIFIEEILGLKKEGDSVLLVRRNAVNLSCIAYLEAKKAEESDERS